MQLSIIEILIIVGAFQGLLLIIGLSRIRDGNREANFILVLFLLSAMVMLIGRLIYGAGVDSKYWSYGPIIDSVIFVHGPLLLNYLKRCTYQSKFRLPWWHYIPFVLQLVKGIYFGFVLSSEEYVSLLFSGQLTYIMRFTGAIAIFLNLTYLAIGFKVLKKYSQDESLVLSYHQHRVDFLKYYLAVVSFCILCWLYAHTCYHYLQIDPGYINYDIIWIGVSLMTYVVGYYTLVHPDLFRITPILDQKDFKPGLRLTKIQANEIKVRIEQVLDAEKIYLNAQLNLKQLADKVDSSTNDVSWVLNNIVKRTFYDYINQYRICEFKSKINQKKHESLTLLALAHEVGFNSKATFNRAFKLETGETPSEYIRRQSATKLSA